MAVGVTLKEDYVKRVLDRVMKLEIEGVIMNVVSTYAGVRWKAKKNTGMSFM